MATAARTRPVSFHDDVTVLNPAFAKALSGFIAEKKAEDIAEGQPSVIPTTVSEVEPAPVLAKHRPVVDAPKPEVKLEARVLPKSSHKVKFEVAPVPAPVTVKERLSPDAQWDKIPLEHFLEFSESALCVLVRAIRESGKRPVVSFEVASENEYSRIDFGLAVLPKERIQMVVLGGEGLFADLFARSTFFRDEVFGHVDAQPQRHAKTEGMKGVLRLVVSLHCPRFC